MDLINEEHIAFFERATISTERDGNEILPIEYNDNYVTVFPGETVALNEELGFSNSLRRKRVTENRKRPTEYTEQLQEEIEKLKEYKASLINEVVTGKIKV